MRKSRHRGGRVGRVNLHSCKRPGSIYEKQEIKVINLVCELEAKVGQLQAPREKPK
jgi:hypothetical protein